MHSAPRVVGHGEFVERTLDAVHDVGVDAGVLLGGLPPLGWTLAAGAPYAVGNAKRVIYEGYEAGLEAAGELEGTMITGAMATDDGQEGIAAFVEKRDPNWTGT